MSNRSTLSRRALLAGAAAPLALPLLPRLAAAEAPMLGVRQPIVNRVKLGAFEVTTVLAGTTPRPDPHSIFGTNISAEEFAAVSAANNIPTDVAQFYFTPTVVNTGSELILFDTGLNAEGITSALDAAGYAPEQVDKVVITHMHGDHVGGLMDADFDTFENAAVITGAAEHNHWSGTDSGAFLGKVKPLEERMSFLDDGGSVAPGITAMAAFGHTPGHMAYMLESEGKQLVIGADFANHYVYSLAYPDWEVLFDTDKAQAAATRRRMLDMMAADQLPFIGYHMPFPAIGFVEKAGDNFRYAPASYQLL